MFWNENMCMLGIHDKKKGNLPDNGKSIFSAMKWNQ